MRSIIAVFTALCFIGSVYSQPAAARAVSTLEISNAYIFLPIGQSHVGVGYLTITNKGPKDTILKSAKSSISDTVELHDHVMNGEIMQMRKLAQVPIPLGTTEFKSGGLHLMLIQMKDGLKAGETYPVTLTFDEQVIEQPFLIKSR